MKNALRKIFIYSMLMAPVMIHMHCGDESKASLEESMNRGKVVYEKYCLTCHQADGSGVQKLNPPLRGTSFVLGDPIQLIQIVKKGMSGVQVDEETYNNPMPAFEQVLDEQQTADVLTYIRNSFGNQAGAVTVADVEKAGK